MSSFGDMLISLFVFVIVFGAILFLAYATAKVLGNKSGRAMRGRYIKTIESISLGVDGKLHLVKVGEEFVLLSASGKSIQFLTKVDIEGFAEEETYECEPFPFKEMLNKCISSFKRKDINGDTLETNAYMSSIGNDGMRKNLDKLKKITSRNRKLYATGGDENTNENQG